MPSVGRLIITIIFGVLVGAAFGITHAIAAVRSPELVEAAADKVVTVGINPWAVAYIGLIALTVGLVNALRRPRLPLK